MRYINALLIAIVLAGPIRAESEHPYVWGNDPRHNMVMQAEGLPVHLDANTMIWHREVAKRHQFPMPAVVGDKILSGADGTAILDETLADHVRRGGTVTCRNLHTGEPIWQIVVPYEAYTHSYGVCTTPVVQGDRVYILALTEVLCLDLDGLADGNQGMTDELAFQTTDHNKQGPIEDAEKITELPATSGDILWRFSLNEWGLSYQDASSGSPILVGDQLWIATSHQMGTEADGHRRKGQKLIPGDPATRDVGPHLIVLDKNTGKLIARDRTTTPIVFHGEWSSPSLVEVDGERFVIFPDGYGVIQGFAIPTPAEDGSVVDLEKLWEIDINPREWRYDEQGRRRPYTEDRRLWFKYPYSYPDDANTWQPIEEYDDLRNPGPCEIIARPAVVGNRAYVGLGRDCYYMKIRHKTRKRDRSINPFTLGRFVCVEFPGKNAQPRIVWESRQVGRTQSTAAVHGGNVYVADSAGRLSCLDAETGQMRWQLDLDNKITCRSLMLAEGKIYVANDRGEMHVIDVTASEPRILSKTRLRSDPTTVGIGPGLVVVGTLKSLQVHVGPGYAGPAVPGSATETAESPASESPDAGQQRQAEE